MRKSTPFIMLSIFLLQSCISKKKYHALEKRDSHCHVELTKAEKAKSEFIVKNEALQEKSNLLESQNNQLRSSLESCLQNANLGSTNITKLLDEVQRSNVYIKKLVDNKFKNDSLNMYISNSLKRSLTDINDKDVNVKVQKGVVLISLSDKMLYTTGSYEVSPSAENVLNKVALIINDYKDYDVVVQGHTDNVPYSSSKGVIKDNWDLSTLRATSVVRILQDRFNVDPKRLTAAGRSYYEPKASNDTEAGRAENRRTVIIVTPKLDQFLDLMDEAPPVE